MKRFESFQINPCPMFSAIMHPFLRLLTGKNFFTKIFPLSVYLEQRSNPFEAGAGTRTPLQEFNSDKKIVSFSYSDFTVSEKDTFITVLSKARGHKRAVTSPAAGMDGWGDTDIRA